MAETRSGSAPEPDKTGGGTNRRVRRGTIIPEGRQVCPAREKEPRGYQWTPPKKHLRDKVREAIRILFH